MRRRTVPLEYHLLDARLTAPAPSGEWKTMRFLIRKGASASVTKPKNHALLSDIRFARCNSDLQESDRASPIAATVSGQLSRSMTPGSRAIRYVTFAAIEKPQNKP